jgi:hypothetical protein
MARMSIDDMVQRDPRITKLAMKVGWSRRETTGCLVLDIWPICYDQRESAISADLVDIAAGAPGFAAAMVECDLADWVRGNRKVRIRGAQERIEYLDHKKRAGRVGGIKSAESRNKNSSTGGSTTQAAGNPSVPDSASVPVNKRESGSPAGLALLFDKVDTATGDVGQERNARAARKKAASSPDHQAAIDGFHQRFKAKYGTKPTWDGKAIGLLSALIKRHPLATLLDRMDFMFEGRAKWPPGPYSASVFVQHFDRWVDEHAPSQPPMRRIDEL